MQRFPSSCSIAKATAALCPAESCKCMSPDMPSKDATVRGYVNRHSAVDSVLYSRTIICLQNYRYASPPSCLTDGCSLRNGTARCRMRNDIQKKRQEWHAQYDCMPSILPSQLRRLSYITIVPSLSAFFVAAAIALIIPAINGIYVQQNSRLRMPAPVCPA